MTAVAFTTPPRHGAGEPPRRATSPGSWLRRRNIARFEMGCVAAFHLGVGLTIALAPRDQVITPGTSVIFGTIGLPIWVIWFLATGTVALAAVDRPSSIRLSLTWIGVFPLGAAWIYGFSCAVLTGHGNAVLALVWPFLLIWWASLAVRTYFGGTGAKWGGG